MDNGRTRLVILLLGDPHLLEGGEGGQDGSSDPDRVLPLRRSDDLDLHGGRSQGSDLLLHPVSDAGVHGGAAGEDSVGVEILPDVHIALHDGVVGGLVDTTGLHTQERGLEQSLGAPEPLISDSDHLNIIISNLGNTETISPIYLSVGKLVRLLKAGAAGSSGHLLLEVESDIAEFLLDVADNLPLGGCGKAKHFLNY